MRRGRLLAGEEEGGKFGGLLMFEVFWGGEILVGEGGGLKLYLEFKDTNEG